MSIPRLVRMPGPVGTHAAGPLVPEDQAATAPKEVMRLVSWLMTYGNDVVGRAHSLRKMWPLTCPQDELFLARGDPGRMGEIRRVCRSLAAKVGIVG